MISFRFVVIRPSSLCIVIQLLLSHCIYVNINYYHEQHKTILLNNIDSSETFPTHCVSSICIRKKGCTFNIGRHLFTLFRKSLLLSTLQIRENQICVKYESLLAGYLLRGRITISQCFFFST